MLGIDASLRSTGLGVVEQQGTQLRALAWYTVKNAQKLPHSECLAEISRQVSHMIKTYQPGAAAIEGGFYLKSAKTAMVLGETRGVSIAACATGGIPVYEYSPKRIKQSVVGVGTAQKKQVEQMVRTLLNLEADVQEDAADALAIAICHLHSNKQVAGLAPKPI